MTHLLSHETLSMTSREIAELTGKRHDNVLRDIDGLLESLSSELRTGFSTTYDGRPEHGYRVYLLDRDSAYCLVAGYDPNSRMKIIKRWQELEARQPSVSAEQLAEIERQHWIASRIRASQSTQRKAPPGAGFSLAA